MTRRHVALSLALAALLLAVALPGSSQSAREEASLTDLVSLLQSEDATEEELAAALSEAERLLGDPPACDPENPMFDDVPADSIFCPFIEELARRGITTGCDGNNFCPGDPVTRAQMATFIVRTLGEPTWHEIGAPGEPEFNHPVFGINPCLWENFDSAHSSAGFLRDDDGFVHLKGVVQVEEGEISPQCGLDFSCGLGTCVAGRTIFVLPEELRPARRQVFTALTNGELARITVYPSDSVVTDESGTWDLSGAVVADPPTSFANADQWVSLDGISFRVE